VLKDAVVDEATKVLESSASDGKVEGSPAIAGPESPPPCVPLEVIVSSYPQFIV
tara:strand:- start:1433 stop:1594 length:162 start_codon:yes stop_codon:yes gene_type:complete